MMKKAFLTVALAASALLASAQLRSVDVKWAMNNLDNGFGVGVTYSLGESFEFAPIASLYFPGGSAFSMTAEADLHYLLEEKVENLELYPLVGVGFARSSSKNDDDAWTVSYNVLFNVGGGARYNLSDTWSVFAEEKFQIVDGLSNVFSIGINYKF